MRVLIFEDEIPASNRIIRFVKELRPNWEVLEVLDSVESGVGYLEKNELPNLILSDIELADGLCFNIFKKCNIQIPVIFTTAYNQYAIRAFEANAIDYLLKPVKKEDLEVGFRKVESRVGKNRPEIDYGELAKAIESRSVSKTKRILVKYGNKLFVVDPNDAAYFYSVEKSTFMVDSEGKSYPIDDGLNKVIQDINTDKFFQINRNFIVNIDSIQEMRSESKGRLKILLNPSYSDPEKCIVSAERAPQFRKWLRG